MGQRSLKIGEAVNHLLELDKSIAIDNARRIVDCVISLFMVTIK